MSLYTEATPTIDLGDGCYITNQVIIWELGKKSSGYLYKVPAGFKFDVSVPKYLRWAFDPSDKRFVKAAALHDHMLINEWSRIESAAVFHEALKADGVSRFERFTMFIAVVLWKYS